MKFLNFDRIICISPHPDDVEYSMAGTILKYNDTHFDILCLTQGGDCDETTGSGRIEEVKNVWKRSNIDNFSLYFTNNKLLKELGEDEWINYIESNFINKFKYDCIITPSQFDSHFEHKIVCNLGYALTRINPISLIEYYSPSTLETWIPNVFIDINDVYETKINMLMEFKSQIHKTYFSINTLNEFHTNFRCSKRKIGKVEQFKFKQIFL